jgi:hypothetical protein
VRGKIVPSIREPRLSCYFALRDRECNFAAKNFYTISTDTHIDDMVITLVVVSIALARRAHKNVAGTVHFEALLDQNLLIASSDAVRDHPRGTTSGGGPCCRIVSVVKNHTGVKAGFGIDSFAANKVKEFPAAAREIFRSAIDIEAKDLQRL